VSQLNWPRRKRFDNGICTDDENRQFARSLFCVQMRTFLAVEPA
jgi:hypothetical protein